MSVKDGAGRYDNLHGDEPEIEAERVYIRHMKDEWDADHWDDWDELPEVEGTK